MKITLASLFDGIGGSPLSAVMCGAEPIWASEIEPFPIKVTKMRFPNMIHHGGITKIIGSEVEPVDIIVGGSPCQDLSVAGKRAGMKHADMGDEEGTRSGLFMEQIRIIKEMRNATRANGHVQPRFMVWENVPGAFSSNEEDDFRIVLEETARIADPAVRVPRPPDGWFNSGSILGDGFSVSWRTVDAQYWGVPQRRRRIYLVADFGGQSAPEILFESGCVSGDSAQGGNKGKGIAGEVEDGIRDSIICSATQQGGAERLEDLCPTITASAGMAGNMGPWIAKTAAGFIGKASGKTRSIGYAEEQPPTVDTDGGDVICLNDQGGSIMDVSDKVGTLRSEEHGHQPLVFEPRSQDGVPRVSTDGLSPTINTAQGGQRQPCIVDPTCSIGNGQVNQIKMQKEIAGALNCMHDQQCVIEPISIETYHCETNNGIASVLKARDWEDPQCVYAVDCRNMVENTEISGTLQAKENGGQSLSYQNPLRIGQTVRRLTPLECERLQGYPDGWTDIPGATDSPRYKSLGNSFAIPNAYFVISGCVEVIRKERNL